MTHRTVAKLILYVVDRSAACDAAIATVYRALRRFPHGAIELDVRNLSRVHDRDRTARDRSILIVPTLAMVQPRESHLIAHVDVRRVVDFLRAAGIAPRAGAEETP